MDTLGDLRVLDLTRVLGGPYCTMLLADMGADVVKIEPPGGDPVRGTPPFPEEAGDEGERGFGGYFQSVNRGKRSLELDLGDAEDREAFLDLVETADVVVENYRPGVMEQFELEYERLAEHNPRLIYTSVRGFGDPRTLSTRGQDDPVYDLVVQALSGVMAINGQPDDPPTKVGPGIGDVFSGTMAALGTLAALHYRERTGEGQYVDVSMFDSMVSLCERAVYRYSYTGEVPTRHGNGHPLLFPYDAFETTDGTVVVGAIGEGQWRSLCRVMGLEELADEFAPQDRRLERREFLRSVLAEWIGERTTEAVLERLTGEVAVAPVQDVADLFDDERAHDREMLVPVEHPGLDRPVTVAGTPIKMTESTNRVRGRAPLLDEHRDEVVGPDGTEPAGDEAEPGAREPAGDEIEPGARKPAGDEVEPGTGESAEARDRAGGTTGPARTAGDGDHTTAGSNGTAGSVGDDGTAGSVGDNGSAGADRSADPAGNNGSAGADRSADPAGNNGAAGADRSADPAGNNGTAGADRSADPAGNNGAAGADRSTDPVAGNGTAGAAREDGSTGAAGTGGSGEGIDGEGVDGEGADGDGADADGTDGEEVDDDETEEERTDVEGSPRTFEGDGPEGSESRGVSGGE